MPWPTETLGPFAVGEIPEDIVNKFRRPSEQGGGPIDITDWSSDFIIVKPDDTVVTRTAVISDGPNGEVSYTWQENDLDQAGDFDTYFWVYKGTEVRLVSKIIQLQVHNLPGVT